jgi:hypothetical protein
MSINIAKKIINEQWKNLDIVIGSSSLSLKNDKFIHSFLINEKEDKISISHFDKISFNTNENLTNSIKQIFNNRYNVLKISNKLLNISDYSYIKFNVVLLILDDRNDILLLLVDNNGKIANIM